MIGAGALAYRMAYGRGGMGGSRTPSAAKVNILHGDDIFGDGPYPRLMSEFVGQETARTQLLTAMASCQKRGNPMPHTLLGSGTPGIGKTTLAKLVASMLGKGYVEVGGNVTVKDVRPVFEAMSDGDILFLDEIHRLVSVKRTNAEWLLQLLTDWKLVLPTGVVDIPKITVIGATTDMQKLPRTVLDRFPIQPVLEPYTPEEGVQIAQVTAKRLNMTCTPTEFHQVAAAADYNPRVMARLLEQMRSIQDASLPGDTLALAMDWMGLTYDGLNRVESDYLMLLFGYGGTASVGTMKAVLSESALDQTERVLISRGYITIGSRGRELTSIGVDRARSLLEAMAPKEA